MPYVPRKSVADTDTQRAIDDVRRAVNKVSSQTDGLQRGLRSSNDISLKHIGDTNLPNGDIVKLHHGLGRPIRGWILSDVRELSGAPLVERVLTDGTTKADDRTDLWLKHTGAGTLVVRLLVY